MNHDKETPLRVPADELDFDDDQIFLYKGKPFTGIEYEVAPDGARSESSYVNGLKEGTEKYWYASGVLKSEATCAGGVYHGHKREFGRDGTLAADSLYGHGILIRSVAIDEEGNTIETFSLKEDSPNYKVLQAFRKNYVGQ